jgi:SNF2 family DNA or RNA helicase
MLVIRSPDDFRRYAGKSQEKWDLLIGGTLEHRVFGIGVVRSITVKTGFFGNVQIKIQFNSREMTFAPSLFNHVNGISFSSMRVMNLRKLGLDTSQLKPPNHGLPSKPFKQAVQIPQHLREKSSQSEPIQNKQIQPTQLTGEHYEGVVSRNPQSETFDQQEFKEECAETPLPKFAVLEKVSLRQEPFKTGVIQSNPLIGGGQFNYNVFFSANEQRIVAEKDLMPIPKEIRFSGEREFLRDLLMLKLQKPLEDNLYSAYASKTKFEVYQFKPAVKFLRNASQRLLIADEVGLGKTIEAGIIYLELQARLDLARVLIVCPSGLRYKWQDEFKSRFDEEFTVLDSAGFNRFVNDYRDHGQNTRLRGIISLEFLRLHEPATALTDENILFDLVVIDEAHHCRNSETLTNRMATILEDHSDAMLLLTATPLQTSNRDLFNLFRIMEPGEFDEFEAFEQRLDPNIYINDASRLLEKGDHQNALKTLRKVEATSQRRRFQANPYYQELVTQLEKERLSKHELVAAQRSILDLNTLAMFFTRTRRRDVVLKPPIRTAETIKVPFTREEMDYYTHVIAFVTASYIHSHPGLPVYTWITMMKERQVASCISAFHKKFLDNLDSPDAIEIEEEGFDFPITFEFPANFLGTQTYHKTLDEIGHYIKDWKAPEDTKYKMFIGTLRKILGESPETKVLVFSFFRGTVDYLQDHLEREGIRALKMHGGFNIVDRQNTIENFRANPEVRVLVSSDVGAEGLDFQFCDTIFNYDLPWNPMKLEQRIGRIDRFGQQSRRVRIYNMVIDETIESRILMRLYDRIGLFERAIGDIEVILGEEINNLAELVFSKTLSQKEEAELVERTVKNILRREQDMDDFEQQRLQFMGQDVIFANRIQQTLDEGGYISEKEMCALVGSFLVNVDPLSRIDCNPEKDGTYTLLPNDTLDHYVRHFVMEERRGDMTAQSFLKRLRSGHEMPMTFSGEKAYERKPLEFVTARHPLAQAAYAFWRDHTPLGETAYKLQVTGDMNFAGEYHFFIFLLDMQGTKSSILLQPVVVNPRTNKVHSHLSRDFLNLAQKGLKLDSHVLISTDLESFSLSSRIASQHILALRTGYEERFRKENEMFINARKFALAQSYEAKQNRIISALDKVREERIIRMREGELRNLASRNDFLLAELERRKDISVSHSLALQGFLVVQSI